MAGNMSSMPGGRRCRFEPADVEYYDTEEEARAAFDLDAEVARSLAVDPTTSAAIVEDKDSYRSPDSLDE